MPAKTGKLQPGAIDAPYYDDNTARMKRLMLRALLPFAAASLAALSLTACATAPDAAPAHPLSAQRQQAFGRLEASLVRTMAEDRLPGLSVAVFDDYRLVRHFEIGTRRAGGDMPIGPDTRFSTASISKPVTALVCLLLAERGALDLNEPIRLSLKRWSLPASDIAGAADVTWRQLLAHRGGTTQHGFADYYEGDALPTLVDSLEGRIPRYDTPIAFTFSPGTDWTYSGGGYVIVQLALEDRFGEPLPALAERLVFGPLGMADSTMIQPGEAGFPADAALVHDEDGKVIRTGLPITPQISASGMWSTPIDLARFAIAFQSAFRGEGPIPRHVAEEMTRIISLKDVGGMALPWFRGFGFAGQDWFRHDGSNTGTGGEVMGTMTSGRGLAILANGDNDNRERALAVIRRDVPAIMGWQDEPATIAVPQALRRPLPGRYKGLLYGLGLDYQIVEHGDDLAIRSDFFRQFLAKDESALIYMGDNVFRVADYPNRLRFEVADGAVSGVTIFRPGSDASPVYRSIADLRPQATPTE